MSEEMDMPKNDIDRRLKSCGIEDIPVKLKKLKFLVNIYHGDSLTLNLKERFSSFNLNDRAYISSKDIDIETSKINYINGMRIPSTLQDYRIAPAGSSLLCIEGGSAGRKIAFTDQEIHFVNKIACLFGNNISNKFIFYSLFSELFQSQFKLAMTGLIGGVALSFIRNFVISVPAQRQQLFITKYLDKKTAQIDQAIAIKEQQIERLKEYKQIIIQQAVTQGLDPNVPMKESGVDWIGNIPAHWEIKSLKFIAFLKSGETLSPEQITDSGYPAYGGNGLRGYTKSYTNDGNHILIGRQGALCGNVNYAEGRFYASEHAIVVYSLNKEDILWLGETIKRANFNRLSQSAAQPGIAVNVIKNIQFPYPPLSEQKNISQFILKNSEKIEIAINLQQQQIQKLKEYKTTLINSAVTGKIKITPEMIAQ